MTRQLIRNCCLARILRNPSGRRCKSLPAETWPEPRHLSHDFLAAGVEDSCTNLLGSHAGRAERSRDGPTRYRQTSRHRPRLASSLRCRPVVLEDEAMLKCLLELGKFCLLCLPERFPEVRELGSRT